LTTNIDDSVYHNLEEGGGIKVLDNENITIVASNTTPKSPPNRHVLCKRKINAHSFGIHTRCFSGEDYRLTENTAQHERDGLHMQCEVRSKKETHSGLPRETHLV
jgi:hypothetical protein